MLNVGAKREKVETGGTQISAESLCLVTSKKSK